MSYEFRDFAPGLALSVLDFKPVAAAATRTSEDSDAVITNLKREVDYHFSRFDIKRLESYSNNIVDYHVIVDLLPAIARFYFLDKFSHRLAPPSATGDNNSNNLNEGGVSLSYVQAAILLGLGLQHKTIEQLVGELTLQSNQVLAMFNKSTKKIAKFFKDLEEWEIAKELPTKEDSVARAAALNPLAKGLEEELNEEAEKSIAALQDRQATLLSTLGDEYVPFHPPPLHTTPHTLSSSQQQGTQSRGQMRIGPWS